MSITGSSTFILVIIITIVSSLTIQNGYIHLNNPKKGYSSSGSNINLLTYKARGDCPYCDSSVYSYCSDKLLHDACCCQHPYPNQPYPPFYRQLPPQCRVADCSFLHANTCNEHFLITRCCCS